MRSPSTLCAAHARYAESVPPEYATISDPHAANVCTSRSRLASNSTLAIVGVFLPLGSRALSLLSDTELTPAPASPHQQRLPHREARQQHRRGRLPGVSSRQIVAYSGRLYALAANSSAARRHGSS